MQVRTKHKVKSDTKEQCDSLSDNLLGIVRYNPKRPNADMFLEMRTSAGIFSFRPTKKLNYTDLLRSAIETMISFNTKEIDPLFYRAINMALEHSSRTEVSKFNEDDWYPPNRIPAPWSPRHQTDDEPLPWGLVSGNEEGKAEEAVLKLPKKGNYKLVILNCEDNDTAELVDIIDKAVPLKEIERFLSSKRAITLPYKKAIELYISLRGKEVILNIKPGSAKKPIYKKALDGSEQLQLSKTEKSIS